MSHVKEILSEVIDCAVHLAADKKWLPATDQQSESSSSSVSDEETSDATSQLEGSIQQDEQKPMMPADYQLSGILLVRDGKFVFLAPGKEDQTDSSKTWNPSFGPELKIASLVYKQVS